MLERLVCLVKWGIVVLLAFRVGIVDASEENQDATSDESREVVAQNRSCAIEVPKDWSSVVDPTGRSVISMGNLARGQFLSVSIVAKDDFDGSSVDVLNQSVAELVAHMQNHFEGEPATCQVGGIPAEQVRITGIEDRYKYIYTLIVAENKTCFYRIVTFAKPSTEQEAEQVYAKVLSTFKPLDPKP